MVLYLLETIKYDIKHFSDINFKNATKVICMLTRITYLMFFSNICTTNLLVDFKKVYPTIKKKLKIANFQHWHSYTIAVVADADTEIIVTGATKLAAPSIQIFEDAINNISHI